MQTPLIVRRLNRLRAQLAATGVTVGFRSVGGVLSPVWPDGSTPTDADRAKVDAVFASFRLDDDAAQKDFDAEAEIDAVPDAIVDLIRAGGDRERAKADRKARRTRP